MKYVIRDRKDDIVLVLDEQGQVIGNFESVKEAIDSCDWMDDIFADELDYQLDSAMVD